MQLVVLAAGHGRRFGGLKQLAPVGPNGESIMDYTARSARRCGFDGIVLVVRSDIRDEVEEHVRQAWPTSLPVELVEQLPIAGTAPAVYSARQLLDGAFAVANADDLYGEQALQTLHDTLRGAGVRGAGVRGAGVRGAGVRGAGEGDGATASGHVMVAYRLRNTVLTAAPVTRGLCEADGDGYLVRILEQSVRRRPEGDFDAAALGAGRRSDPEATWEERRNGDELVSMNLWGFQPSILAALERVVLDGAEGAEGAELLLPDVVAGVVASGEARLSVVATEARCIGLTHPEDIDLVRRAVAVELAETPGAGSAEAAS